MPEIIVWDIFSIFLAGIAFCIFIIGGFLYLKKGREKETFNERIILFGYAGTLFSFACAEIFVVLFYISLVGTFKDSGFYVDSTKINNLSAIFYKAVSISYYFGFLILTLVFEIYYKRTKFILTIIGFLTIFLAIIIPYPSELSVIPYAYTLILSIIVLIIFTRWSQLEYRVIASYLLFGCVCIGWAIGLSGVTRIYGRNIVPPWVIPLFICIGAIFMVAPTLITPKNLSHSLVLSVIFNFCILGLQVFFLLVFIHIRLPIQSVILILIFTSIYIYIQYSTIKTIKSIHSKGVTTEEIESQRNVFGMFVKPQKITEEEVTISKEKKICLVCKNEISRDNYICPECKAFYCSKCSEALINLENACWVCETPFDESKPVKLPEKKEEEIILEDDVHKKEKIKKK